MGSIATGGCGVLIFMACSHIMKMLWHGNAFHITGPLWGKSINDRRIPHSKASNVDFDIWFVVNMNKLLNKHSSFWWFEMMLMWRHSNVVAGTHPDRCRAEPQFNINISSYQYRKSHCGDKTVVRWSYLHNGISYTVRYHLYIELGPRFFVEHGCHQRASSLWDQNAINRETMDCQPPATYFTKEVKPSLAIPPLKFNSSLA